MLFHDKAASKAIASGKGADYFRTAAQKRANVTWFLLLAAGAIWYFIGWGWALIPLALGIIKAIGSIDSSIVAAKIEKLGGNQYTARAEKLSADVTSIIQAYGSTLENYAPTSGCVADARKLPYPKQEIKTALIISLKETDDPQMKEQLKIAYIHLSDWQEGVGESDHGIDFTKIDPNQDAEDLANALIDQSSGYKDWSMEVLKEQEVLKQELHELDLW